MHRLRDSFWSLWYTLVTNRVGFRKGFIYVPTKYLKDVKEKNGVLRLELTEGTNRAS